VSGCDVKWNGTESGRKMSLYKQNVQLERGRALEGVVTLLKEDKIYVWNYIRFNSVI
jgi:hypothetical protein